MKQTPQSRPSFWSNLPAWIVYGLFWLMAQLPFRLLLLIGRGLGWLFKVMLKSRRQVVRKNLTACFPHLDPVAIDELINQNYRETGMMVSQTLRTFLNRSPRYFKDLKIEGMQHLHNCLDQGQGVLLVSGHFTALDVGGRVICEQFPVAGVYRPHKNAVQEYVVKRSRLTYAKKMFSRDELKGIVKHLKSAGVVWYAPDQDYRRGQSLFSNFFGIPASTITATHQLARISQCKVMFFAVKRIEHKPYYELSLSAPLENFPTQNVQADIDRINQGIEQMVKQAPSQYLWLHKRFKTRPEGSAKFY